MDTATIGIVLTVGASLLNSGALWYKMGKLEGKLDNLGVRNYVNDNSAINPLRLGENNQVSHRVRN